MNEYSVTSVRKADSSFEHTYDGERNNRVFTITNDPFASRLRAEHEDILKLTGDNEIRTIIRGRK